MFLESDAPLGALLCSPNGREFKLVIFDLLAKSKVLTSLLSLDIQVKIVR